MPLSVFQQHISYCGVWTEKQVTFRRSMTVVHEGRMVTSEVAAYQTDLSLSKWSPSEPDSFCYNTRRETECVHDLLPTAIGLISVPIVSQHLNMSKHCTKQKSLSDNNTRSQSRKGRVLGRNIGLNMIMNIVCKLQWRVEKWLSDSGWVLPCCYIHI